MFVIFWIFLPLPVVCTSDVVLLTGWGETIKSTLSQLLRFYFGTQSTVKKNAKQTGFKNASRVFQMDKAIQSLSRPQSGRRRNKEKQSSPCNINWHCLKSYDTQGIMVPS